MKSSESVVIMVIQCHVGDKYEKEEKVWNKEKRRYSKNTKYKYLFISHGMAYNRQLSSS
jgi:uncharacterized UPF0160 family protein